MPFRLLRLIALITMVCSTPSATPGKMYPNMDGDRERGLVFTVKFDVYILRNNTLTKLTTFGLDIDPVISPDASKVAFIRKVPGKQVETTLGKMAVSEIWFINADGTGSKRLVANREGSKVEETLAGFSNLHFSANGKLLYFNSAAGATSGTLNNVDLESGTVKHVVPFKGKLEQE